VLCPRPPLWATLCQAVAHCSGRHLCAAWPSSSRRWTTVSRATAHALSVSGADHAAPCAHCAQTRAASYSRPGQFWAAIPRPARRGGQAAAGRVRAVRVGRAWFRPKSSLKIKKFLFYFSFGFKLNSNFKILYLNIQSSKNYETSSIGFINFLSIQ
jgi:hypothetical protein